MGSHESADRAGYRRFRLWLYPGFYGMNVKGLPWADSPYGLGIAFTAMAVMTVVLLWVLKRFNWL